MVNNTEFSGVRMTPNFLCVTSLKKKTKQNQTNQEQTSAQLFRGRDSRGCFLDCQKSTPFQKSPSLWCALASPPLAPVRSGAWEGAEPPNRHLRARGSTPRSTAGWASPWVMSSDSGSTLVLCGVRIHWTLSFYIFIILMSGHDKKCFFF